MLTPVDASKLSISNVTTSQRATAGAALREGLPRLDTARLRCNGDTGIRQVLRDGVGQHVLGVTELEDSSQVDMAGHDVLLDELSRGVKSLWLLAMTIMITENIANASQAQLTLSW